MIESIWSPPNFRFRTLVSERRRHLEHGGVADPRETTWVIRIGNAAGGAKHILKIGCQQPSRLALPADGMGIVVHDVHRERDY
jgi:hypothetical protein